jgi:hypothetical protein
MNARAPQESFQRRSGAKRYEIAYFPRIRPTFEVGTILAVVGKVRSR